MIIDNPLVSLLDDSTNGGSYLCEQSMAGRDDDISNKGCTFKSSPPPFAKLRKSLNQEKLVWLYQNVVYMSKPSKSVNT